MAENIDPPDIYGHRVAVVTGSNKGIGKAIVRGLCKQFDGRVYLTSRDVMKGQQAVYELEMENLYPCFHQLDINDPRSINRLRLHLEQNYGGLDVLVNNAGMAFPVDSEVPFAEQAEVTTKTNFWGTLAVCNKLFPILKSHARVVHVSSTGGAMALKKCSSRAKEQIARIKTVAEVEKLMTEFVESAKKGDYEERGYPESSFAMTKMALNILAPLQQAHFDEDPERTDVVVNSCCPGFVNTDLSDHSGGVSPDEGADTPIYLCLLRPDDVAKPTGRFVHLRRVRSVEASEEEVKHIDEIFRRISVTKKPK